MWIFLSISWTVTSFHCFVLCFHKVICIMLLGRDSSKKQLPTGSDKVSASVGNMVNEVQLSELIDCHEIIF